MKTDEKKRSVTPERAQAMLAEMGINIPLAKAAMVLDFMYKICNLEVERLNKK